MPTVHPTQPEAGPLYYASLCGFVGLAEHMIAAHSEDVNREGGSHTTRARHRSITATVGMASGYFGFGMCQYGKEAECYRLYYGI